MNDNRRPMGKAPARKQTWTTLTEPPAASRTRRGLNVLGIIIAVVAAVLLVPATYRHQMERFGTLAREKRRMYELVGITETKAIERFGKPNAQIEYQLTKGSIMGPLLGQKNYYPLDSPDYAKHQEEAKVIWSYPAYSAVRELTWKLPDAYLTMWFQEPRAELTFSGDNADLALPATGPGEWVALDNYRVGLDLIAPARGGSAPAKP